MKNCSIALRSMAMAGVVAGFISLSTAAGSAGAQTTSPAFVGINLNGPAVTINGQRWLSHAEAVANGLTETAPNNTTSSVIPVPSDDADTRVMLQTGIWGSGSWKLEYPVPVAGHYNIYFWVMENHKTDFRSFDVRLENRTTIGGVGLNMAKGSWKRFGPYDENITDGKLTLDLIDGKGDPHLMGIEIMPIQQPEQPSITILSPMGGENYDGGPLVVSWSQQNAVGPVEVRLYNPSTGASYYTGSFSGGTSNTNISLSSSDLASVPSGQYRVSINDKGSSYGDTSGSFTLVSDTISAPPPPSAVTSVSCGGRISITWPMVAGATGYNLYRDGSSTPLSSLPITSTTFEDVSLVPVSTHMYELSALNSAGESGRSLSDPGTSSGACVSDTHTLSVTKAGTGSGTVVSSPSGIICGTDCSENYLSGTQVTLTALPSSNSTFGGWSGACVGTSSTCYATTNAPLGVTATFHPAVSQPSITVLTPNGGESYQMGNTLGVAWLSNSQSLDYRIRILSNVTEAEYYSSVVKGLPGNNIVTLPSEAMNMPAGQYMVLVCDASAGEQYIYCDGSDSPFTIVSATTVPSITVLSPNGGEKFTSEKVMKIRWLSKNLPTNTNITLDVVNEQGFVLDHSTRLNSGSAALTVTASIPSGRYKIRVYCVDSPYSEDDCASPDPVTESTPIVTEDYSDSYFNITQKYRSNLVPRIFRLEGPRQLLVAETGMWRIAAYDPESGPIRYTIRWGDGTSSQVPEQPPFQTAIFTHSYSSAGAYTIDLFAIDNKGAHESSRQFVTVLPSTSSSSITVSNSLSVPAQNIAVSLANQPLGGIDITVTGAPATVNSLDFGGVPNSIVNGVTNIVLVDQNGNVVAGPVDAGANPGQYPIRFTDSFTVPVGKTTYTLKGKLPSTVSSDSAITFNLAGTSVAPGHSVSIAYPVVLSTMTAKSGHLAVRVLDETTRTIVAGAQRQLFTTYILDTTNSSENISVRSLTLPFNASGVPTNLSNCGIVSAGGVSLTTGVRIVNPLVTGGAYTFALDVPRSLPKGTSQTITLECNVTATATGSYQWGLASNSIAAISEVTGATPNMQVTASIGPLVTVTGGGGLSVYLDASSPAYRIGAAGTTGNVLSVLRISAINEDIRLTSLALQLPNNASSSPYDIANGRVTLWDGSTQVGEAVFTGGRYTAMAQIGSCSGCQHFIAPNNSSKLLTIKADFADQGTGSAGTPGSLVAVDWDSYGTGEPSSGITGIGLSSGMTVGAGGTDTMSNGVRVFKSYPAVALRPLPTSRLSAGRQDLLRFQVTATSSGPIGVAKLTFRIATASAVAAKDMVDNVNVYAYTDASYSTPVTDVQPDGAFSNTDLDLSTHWRAASKDLELWAASASGASTTLIIPAGTTRYLAIRGDVTTAGTQYSVSTQLQGDAKFIGGSESGGNDPVKIGAATTTYLASSTVIHRSDDNDFIWRPFSTSTTQGLEAIDYANGYGVPGLPTNSTGAQALTASLEGNSNRHASFGEALLASLANAMTAFVSAIIDPWGFR